MEQPEKNRFNVSNDQIPQKELPAFSQRTLLFGQPTLFQAYVGKAEWALFEELEPELNENADQETLDEDGE